MFATQNNQYFVHRGMDRQMAGHRGDELGILFTQHSFYEPCSEKGRWWLLVNLQNRLDNVIITGPRLFAVHNFLSVHRSLYHMIQLTVRING